MGSVSSVSLWNQKKIIKSDIKPIKNKFAPTCIVCCCKGHYIWDCLLFKNYKQKRNNKIPLVNESINFDEHGKISSYPFKSQLVVKNSKKIQVLPKEVSKFKITNPAFKHKSKAPCFSRNSRTSVIENVNSPLKDNDLSSNTKHKFKKSNSGRVTNYNNLTVRKPLYFRRNNKDSKFGFNSSEKSINLNFPRKSCSFPKEFSSPLRPVVSSSVPKVTVQVGDFTVSALLDSGSVCSIMSQDLFSRIKQHKCITHVEPTSMKCLTASKEPLRVDVKCFCIIKLDQFTWKIPILVAPSLSCDLILGANFMSHTRLVLDMEKKNIYFKFKPNYLIDLLLSCTVPSGVSSATDNCLDPLSCLDPKHAADIRSLMLKYSDVLTSELGLTDLITYKIQLSDSTPVKSHPYQLALPKFNFMREHINKLLDLGVIQPSSSPYASPAFLVTRPDKKPRLVVDYRKLNQKVVLEAVPLPNLHNVAQWFAKAKYFSVLDLSSAYHQIPLSPESRPITAFCTPWMLYEYTRLPFGLSSGAQILSRLLDLVFHDIKFRCVFNYLDDIVVFSESWDDHVRHLTDVFERLRKAKLTINPEKVKFGVSEISFLGHIISSQGVRVDPDRTASIRSFPAPKDAKGIARFIGMVNFFNKFIPEFSALAAPLNALRKKGCKFAWGESQQRAFEALKEAIISPPTLRIPDFEKEFVLQTDASSCALAAVLLQDVDGTRQPIAYASRTLSAAEKKASSAYELECLAVLFGVEKFRQYLEHREFLLETDNQALSWLLAHPRQLGKIGRWIAKITSFKFRVQHIRGTQNVIADTLSRMYEANDEDAKDVGCTNLLLDFPLSFGNLSEYQRKDESVNKIIEELESGQSIPNVCIKNKVLYQADRAGNPLRIILPHSLIDMVFKYFHDCPVGGHLGFWKTYNKILQYFHWRGMYTDIKHRIRSCDTCAVSKPAQNTRIGLLASNTPTRPLEKMYLDYVGQLTRTKKGNLFVLVLVDAFSRYTWLSAVRATNTSITISELTRIFQSFGFPKCLITDNASYFVSKTFRNFCFSNGVDHYTLSPYHPQPSYAERFNRNLKACLIAYHANAQNTWDDSLPWLQLAFNSSIHEATDHTPFEVIFKYQPCSPLALKWRLDELLPGNCADTLKVWKDVRDNLKKAHEKVRKTYNTGRYPHTFEVGHLVWCKNHPQSSAVKKLSAKMLPRWNGPYYILQFLTPVTVKLVDPDTHAFVRKSHVSHLKPYTNVYPDVDPT